MILTDLIKTTVNQCEASIARLEACLSIGVLTGPAVWPALVSSDNTAGLIITTRISHQYQDLQEYHSQSEPAWFCM